MIIPVPIIDISLVIVLRSCARFVGLVHEQGVSGGSMRLSVSAVVTQVTAVLVAVATVTISPAIAAQETDATAAIQQKAPRSVQKDHIGPGHRPTADQIRDHELDKSKDPGRASTLVKPTDSTSGSVATLLTASTSVATVGSISAPGPLTTVATSPDLNCSVHYAGDSAGEFYGDTACGTFVSLGGVLYGPAYVPAGGSASL